jgi:hypothetical protein
MGAVSERRGGQMGNKRGKERQRRRRELRLAQPRVRNALESARREREWVEALAAACEPELDRTVPVTIQRWDRDASKTEPAVVEQPAPLVDLTSKAEGEEWSLGQARMLYRDGYHLAWVTERTGWGAWWFSDLIGPDGYATELREEWDGWADAA